MKKGVRDAVELKISDTDIRQEKPYTMVHIRLSGAWDCTGFAKCRPGDVWNPERGRVIAEGRAIRLAAQKLGLI